MAEYHEDPTSRWEHSQQGGPQGQPPQQSPYSNQPSEYPFGYGPGHDGSSSTPANHFMSNGFSDSTPTLLDDRSAGRDTPAQSLQSLASDPFGDPRDGYGQRMDPRLARFNPDDIMDDGDDGLDYRRPSRNSVLSLGAGSRENGVMAAATGGGVAAGAVAGGVLGGLIGKTRTSQVAYNPVEDGTSYPAVDSSVSPKGDSIIRAVREKEDKNRRNRKRWAWVIGGLVILAIAAAIMGGLAGSGILSSGSREIPAPPGQSAGDDQAKNGDLDINSAEIKALLNNKDLHKVFPGVDYTPINSQYPDCAHYPPSQNNITRDVAVLSQLTNTIRLYGTDCNQTEMTIHALRQLKLEDDIKIWLGVWQDGNKTTNARQLRQMWSILDTYGASHFKGLIVANEILYRKEMSLADLGNLLTDVRKNLTARGMSLPVATSDLGDNWTSALAQVSDYIMSNVHPFFGGINAKDAASWTWSFFQNQNAAFFKKEISHNIISETGWPTQGGTDCGTNTTTVCPDAAKAGIPELNSFMSDWVCSALTNGTNYFWFEMFDEPWKVRFNTPDLGQEWEDHWGLMTVDRKLKDGVKIPDCGGKVVGAP